MEKTSEPRISADISEIEFDEMWHFLQKKSKRIIKAVNRRSRPIIAWVTGGAYTPTFRRLYEKLKYLKNGRFYTDNQKPSYYWKKCSGMHRA
jgi:IS1 family transposase